MFSLSNSGELTTTEARERILDGLTSNTVDPDIQLDTDAVTIETEDPVLYVLNDLGIVFLSTDNLISINSDGSIDAPEFIEGSRVFIDNSCRVTVVFLKETA